MDARALAASATAGVCVAAIVVGVARGGVPVDERPAANASTERPPSTGRGEGAPRVMTGQSAPVDSPGAASPPPPPATTPAPVVPDARPHFHSTAEPPWSGQPAPPPGQRLAGDDATTVAEMARQLLTADATGAGREHFPGMWDGPPSRPCCRQVSVHEVSAGRHPGHPETALVLVTWSGIGYDGQPTPATVTPLAFTRTTDSTGGWQPLPAWRAEHTRRRRHGGRRGGPYGTRQGGRHRRRHGGRHRGRHAPRVPGGNAAGQRLTTGPRGDRHLLPARRRRSEPKSVPATTAGLTRSGQPAPRPSRINRAAGAPHPRTWWSTAVVAPANAGPHDDRTADILSRVTTVAETIAALATLRTLLVAAGTIAVLATAWLALRRLATRRALHPDRRVRLVALPTDTFDPTPEEVDRYAAQLSRARRTVRGSLDRPAHAVRLRLDSIAGGGCAYRIEGSAQAASILRLTGYAEVDLRPADAPLPELGGHVTTPPDADAPGDPGDPGDSLTAAAQGMQGTRHHPTAEETSSPTAAARDMRGTRHHPTDEETTT